MLPYPQDGSRDIFPYRLQNPAEIRSGVPGAAAHALYPLDEYFGGTVRKELPAEYRNLVQMPVAKQRKGLNPPLRKVA